jgi:predicted Zn-dependent protease
MNGRIWPGMLALLLVVAGCVSDEQKLTTVSSNPFSGPTRTQSAWVKQAPQATQKVSFRVNEIGQKIMAANPRFDRKVAFLTLGVPQLEIFHRVRGGNGEIYITEGLVNECKTDGELAAVLSQELGKMMSEEIAKSRPRRDLPEPPPLMAPRVGNDIGGTFGSADGTDQMILARYEKDRKRARQAILAPPPAEDLARIYLQNAGFNANDLAMVKPLLRKAEKNDNLEQLMTGKAAR